MVKEILNTDNSYLENGKKIPNRERIYGIKKGNNQNSLPNNSVSSQEQLAKQIELERIYGIKKGGDRKSNENNSCLISQEELAKRIGLDSSQLRNYKKLNDLIPELQSLVKTIKGKFY